jgi:hypothetical protein
MEWSKPFSFDLHASENAGSQERTTSGTEGKRCFFESMNLGR